MLATKSIYVDPATGDVSADDAGGFAARSPGLCAAISATTTERGSVPALPDWGISLALFTHLSTRTPVRIEAEIERVLRPLLQDRILRYEAHAWQDADGVLRLDLQVVGIDGSSSEQSLVVG